MYYKSAKLRFNYNQDLAFYSTQDRIREYNLYKSVADFIKKLGEKKDKTSYHELPLGQIQRQIIKRTLNYSAL